jgi:predicted Zn-dependent peptidase
MSDCFISEFNDNKFERKNCISKICGMCIQRYFKLLLLIFLAYPVMLIAQPEITISGDLQFVKLSDGLNAVLMAQPQAPNTEIMFYVQAGSTYENDSISGMSNLVAKILDEKLSLGIKNGVNGLNPQNTTFSGSITTERTIYKFITTAANLDACIALVRDSIYNAKISLSEINSARNAVLQQIEDARHDPKMIFEGKLIKGLFVQDHQKLEVLGNGRELKDFDQNAVLGFFKKCYVPNNTYLTVTGNFANLVAEASIVKGFSTIMKSVFNPETITKIVDLRPMAFNTQFVLEDTGSAPEFEICWQFPGTNSNFHESYCAFVVSAILNDKNNYIQVKAAKMGCKKFEVQYEANNFSGILRIHLQPSKQNLYSTYSFVMNELGRIDKTLLNDVMIAAAKIQFKKEYEFVKRSKEYPARIVSHWTFNDESYYPELLDSVMSMQAPRIERFVINYFNQSPHITGLKISKADRQALNIDSLFTDLDQNVGRYVFTYQQNITSVEGGDNKTKLQNLLQWLNINPDVNVQVNGFSDEHEYNKTTDADSIIQFIDSMPTFHMVTSDILKHKPTIRPELARAAKIVRYLYDHGIATDRLCGTSMMFKSANKQEEADNMKCTLTLNKVRKSPSLYEYHYGKKKE